MGSNFHWNDAGEVVETEGFGKRGTTARNFLPHPPCSISMESFRYFQIVTKLGIVEAITPCSERSMP